ncbi:MAG: metalloregulator ArsR/SmtB family transcription factor [Verrucomicrobiota bacterium]|nr:metalloregulator ArsR/SmtB family transcription factor [Chthoniobacterales bacterium]MDQ3413638.1 metalloregulator ArsR/SmtB family transcription factor [Verrucomicrobiota bacterium]
MASTINFLRLLADPTRLRLLLLLEAEELSVAELQDILGMGQSRISSHLAQLKRAGVVEDRRAGKNVYYGLTNGQKLDPQRAKVSELTRTLAREMPETQRDRTALKLVLRKRQDKAREYFDQLAGRFGRSYCPGRSWQALAHTMIALLPPLTVADLGAGEGTLSQLLAKKARKVIAVDNAPKMVEFGARLAKKHGFKNLEYRLGDIKDPPIEKNSIDLAIFSQALHHAIHPERAIAAAHRILKKGGRVVVLDLLSHRFEKARELYADHWLGFSEVQLHQWLEVAGFTGIEVTVVSREKESPHFQTVFATGVK